MKPITNHFHLRNVLTACGVTCHRFAHIMKGQCDVPFNAWIQVYYGRIAISTEMSEAISSTMFGKDSPHQYKAFDVNPLTVKEYVKRNIRTKRRSV